MTETQVQTVADELAVVAQQLSKIATRLDGSSVSSDGVLRRARDLADRHGLKWTVASDRELAITLVLGEISA